ncbi:YifB family Mg chelatase-like AAA ATPase [Campylobacter sp. faydin G-24]|uniref:YifB family Mg chelatase-like AAA ATPase n=1 Tax=Campylobacter anatolicus TaxID=2829105 RepID=A0ABS5HG55_9BACT|nr:YifB family Mg chelatase-like AAA ATPase [Campylobacter anatolicus]MBR8463255.1 YifB family Mg chelatase-like AAA ATPase [Campylobacter anatolicus]
MKSLKCATYADGLKIIDVESVFSRGLPGFNIVGLAGASIKESTERVKAALLGLNFSFPAQKITINLSPSDLPKNGSHFDLSIALLIALQKAKNLEKIFVFGELGLDGSVKNTANLFSLLLFLSTTQNGVKVLVPSEIATRASLIPNLDIYGVSTLNEAIRFFEDSEFAASCKADGTHEIFKNVIEIDGKRYVPNLDFTLDYADVAGQTRAKRACMIAALGMHNILFEGSPGCGKSMCAKRLVYIMPPQSIDEVLSAAAYRSLNLQDSEFSAIRAFRHPHHTSTKSSIFGGGSSSAKIGEVALANGGVLFFDEFLHFAKPVIESLREPLEDHKIHISRVNSKVTYETKFIFVAAQNPCPCGNLLSAKLNCRCSENEIRQYRSRLSEPIMDRIDLYVAMQENLGESIDEDVSKNVDKNLKDSECNSSEQMSERINKAFEFQKLRGQSELNGKLSDDDMVRFCTLDSDATQVLSTAITRYHLSERSKKKVLKVARSIADLELCKDLQKSHILEALSFRFRS